MRTRGSKYTKALARYAKELNNAAKKELGTRRIGKNRNYGVATGKLQKSLSIDRRSTSIRFFSPLPYAQFIHWGVNGTKRSYNSMYSYRSKQPPTEAILQWMKDKPVQARDAKGRFAKRKSAAFLIARSIKEKGIYPLRYYITAFDKTFRKAERELTTAMAEDLFSEFEAQVGSVTMKPS